MLHKHKCGDDNISTIKTSNESHLLWKKQFHENPLYVLGVIQVSKLIMKSINLVYVIIQLIFINKTQYLMVIT